jgi:LasA protease
MRAKMKTRSAARKALTWLCVAVLLLSSGGCGQAIMSPLDRLATMRPVYTPQSGSNQAGPFVPVTDQPTGSPSQEPTANPSPTAENAVPAPIHTPASLEPSPTPTTNTTPAPPILYYTQAGDTLNALALRYGVSAQEITSTDAIPAGSFLNPGQLLLIPSRLSDISNPEHIMPDSEIVFSPSALDFDLDKYIQSTSGYLRDYKEWRANGRDDSANTIFRVAIENSINPRLLLSILEFQGHWVTGQPTNLAMVDYPLGHIDYQKKGLYAQLSWAVQMLNIGYYGWRDGRVTELTFTDGGKIRLAPDLNAGSVAILYLFSQLYDKPNWAGAMYGDNSMPALFEKMFGSPWARAQSVEPLFPATITQPTLELPFAVGKEWSFTGGPHSAWGPDGALASLDFAPATTEHGCYKSEEYVTAMASGLVVRSETGVVVVDLDGDGHEQTGWAIMYLHIATDGRLPVNTWVNLGDAIGHPSCEGGMATGTHVHIARKYNGEWIQADGPMPFVLSGWMVHKGDAPYQGYLTQDGKTNVIASQFGEFKSLIVH